MNSLLAPPEGYCSPAGTLSSAWRELQDRKLAQPSHQVPGNCDSSPREIRRGLNGTQVSRSNGGLQGDFNGGIIHKRVGKLGEKAGATVSRQWGEGQSGAQRRGAGGP